MTAVLINAAAAWAMTGLIWFVQVVHYPLFARVGEDRFPAYQRQHQRRTTWVVAPLMLVELVASFALWSLAPPQVSPTLIVASLALALFLWGATFAIHVPLHVGLERGFDARLHRRLVAANWMRTVAWSARALLAALIVWQASLPEGV